MRIKSVEKTEIINESGLLRPHQEKMKKRRKGANKMNLSKVEAFGTRLESLREGRGLSRRQFSNEIQVSYGTVYNWERGVSKPLLTELLKVTKTLDISVCELLNIKPSKSKFKVEEPEMAIDTFAARMRTARLQKGMKKTRLARALNMTAQAVSSWEEGRTEPNIEVLMKLSDVLETPIEFLLEGKVACSRMNKKIKTDLALLERAELMTKRSTFSKRLKEKRLERCLNQSQFAELIGVSPINVYKWETDRAMPSSDSLQKILNFFELSLNDFLKTPVTQEIKSIESELVLEAEVLEKEEILKSESPLDTVELSENGVEEPIEERTTSVDTVSDDVCQIIRRTTAQAQTAMVETMNQLTEKIVSEVVNLTQVDSNLTELSDVELELIEKVRQLDGTETKMLQSYLDYLISKK